MSSFCLDTSAYSNFRRGNEEVAELLDQAELVGVSTVVVEALPVDAATSRHYAEIVAELRRAETPVPTNDIWIAATAARNGTMVLTCDDHFERIGRVGSIVTDG